MILEPGCLIVVSNASQEAVGYAWCDPASPTTSYWSMPPVQDRPPDAGVTFFLAPTGANVTRAAFIAVVRQNWSSNNRFLTCTETVYTTYDGIPQQYRASFFPNAGSSGSSALPMEVDTGSTGLYSVRGGSVQANVGVTYRDSADPQSYNEYWVLGSGYDKTGLNALSGGSIDPSFRTWSAGMTCVLVSTAETSTEPTS